MSLRAEGRRHATDPAAVAAYEIGLAGRRRLWPNDGVIWKPNKAKGDEISVARLVVSLVVLIAGALALDALPLIAALSRIGLVGTTLLVVGIVVFSIVFFRAYERLTPSSPPTPRRDLAVIMFSALLIGLWTFLLTNEIVTVLVLAGLGAFLLLPEDWQQRFADRLPHR